MSNISTGFATRRIQAATLEELAEKSNEFVYEGYCDAKEGQPYNKHYDGWSKLEQAQYEYGRHIAAINKCHKGVFNFYTRSDINEECAFIAGRDVSQEVETENRA